MDALMANYASDSDSDGGEPAAAPAWAPEVPEASALLPPPPLDLLQPPNFVDYSVMAQGSRVRSFPHVEGNYVVHVYIPVVIPSDAKKQLALAMKRAASLVPDLYAVDADYALSELCKDEQKLEKVLLSREFHVSLGRPVAVQVHQIDSFVAMLRQKFELQQRYWLEFNKWEHFVNDDCTRSFLSLEVTRTGLPEISKQILMVDEVYRLHGLPEFYKHKGHGTFTIKQAEAVLAVVFGDSLAALLKQIASDYEPQEGATVVELQPKDKGVWGMRQTEEPYKFLLNILNGAHLELMKLNGSDTNASELTAIFGGQLRAVVESEGNKPDATERHLMLMISLNISTGSIHTLGDALDNYFSPRMNDSKTTRTTYLIEIPPKVMILRLVRFKTGDLTYKCMKPIPFPNQLVLSAGWLTTSSQAVRYELFATIGHIGGPNMHLGSYYADVQHATGQWLRFDDDTVTPVSWSAVSSRKAYILFYKQVS